mmetsp:Transcript_68083/g.108056  ORF Transcript_68083/g.108056 Transcript_68083/m.108056 type:complete len:677 (-) Transcript_68083:177-2207(-)
MAYSVLCVIFVIPHVRALHIIDCGGEHASFCNANSVISCAASSDCYIKCTKPQSCSEKTIVCPTANGKHCDVDCIGENACIDTIVDAHQLNYGKLSLHAYKHDNVSSASVWSNGSLLCPPSGDCTIFSNDHLNDIDISATSSILLNLTTILELDEDENVLDNANIHCPSLTNAYCEINVHNAVLTNTHIYSDTAEFLWILCDGEFSNKCFNADFPPILHRLCGEHKQQPIECEIFNHNALDCLCNVHGHYTENSTQITIESNVNNPGILPHAAKQTEDTNLNYVVVALCSLVIIFIGGACAFACKLKLNKLDQILKGTSTAMNENDTFRGISSSASPNCQSDSFSISKSKTKASKHTKLSLGTIPENPCSEHVQMSTLLSPNSMRSVSGVSSVQLTVNSIYGQEKPDRDYDDDEEDDDAVHCVDDHAEEDATKSKRFQFVYPRKMLPMPPVPTSTSAMQYEQQTADMYNRHSFWNNSCHYYMPTGVLQNNVYPMMPSNAIPPHLAYYEHDGASSSPVAPSSFAPQYPAYPHLVNVKQSAPIPIPSAQHKTHRRAYSHTFREHEAKIPSFFVHNNNDASAMYRDADGPLHAPPSDALRYSLISPFTGNAGKQTVSAPMCVAYDEEEESDDSSSQTESESTTNDIADAVQETETQEHNVRKPGDEYESNGEDEQQALM